MMPRYHVNPVNGEPGVCRAKIRCPFGDMASDHFNSPEAAREYFFSIGNPVHVWTAKITSSPNNTLDFTKLSEHDFRNKLSFRSPDFSDDFLKEQKTFYSNEERTYFENNGNLFIRSLYDDDFIVRSNFILIGIEKKNKKIYSDGLGIYSFERKTAKLEVTVTSNDASLLNDAVTVKSGSTVNWIDLTKEENEVLLPILFRPYFENKYPNPEEIMFRNYFNKTNFIIKGFDYGE